MPPPSTSSSSSSSAVAHKAADALKRHCHHMINTLGPAAPPEAFLFRANAYYTLGRPYLALADYNTAALVLHLSGSHQVRCHRALEKFPPRQVATYPGTDSHLHIFVQPLLGPSVVLEKEVGPLVGRGLVASADLPAGATVLQADAPWLRYPILDSSCAFCGVALPERAFACVNPDCHEEYCSRDCRTAAMSLYHAPVCTNRAFQSIELDLYAQMMREAHEGSAKAYRRLAQELFMVRLMAVAVTTHVVPSAMPQLRFLRGSMAYAPTELSGPTLNLYERLASALRVHTMVSYEEMLGIIARVRTNATFTEETIELRLSRAMVNHSCDPNAAEDAASGELRTTRPVRAGEELTVNYFPQVKTELSAAERAEVLDREYDFHCHCKQCKGSGGDLNAH